MRDYNVRCVIETTVRLVMVGLTGTMSVVLVVVVDMMVAMMDLYLYLYLYLIS